MKSKLSNNDETAAADFEGKQSKSNAIDYSVAPPLFNSIYGGFIQPGVQSIELPRSIL